MSEKDRTSQCGSHQIVMDELRSLKDEIKGRGSDPDGWKRYQHFILEELKSLKGWLKQVSEEQKNIRIEVASLKVKAGAWGLLGACVPVVIMLGINFLK